MDVRGLRCVRAWMCEDWGSDRGTLKLETADVHNGKVYKESIIGKYKRVRAGGMPSAASAIQQHRRLLALSSIPPLPHLLFFDHLSPFRLPPSSPPHSPSTPLPLPHTPHPIFFPPDSSRSRNPTPSSAPPPPQCPSSLTLSPQDCMTPSRLSAEATAHTSHSPHSLPLCPSPLPPPLPHPLSPSLNPKPPSAHPPTFTPSTPPPLSLSPLARTA